MIHSGLFFKLFTLCYLRRMSAWSLVSFVGCRACLIYMCLTVHEFSFILFIHYNIHFYFELCTYCNILDIYLLWDTNSVKYLLFNMKLLNYLFCNMFGSVLECYELTGVSLLWTRRELANKAKIGLVWKWFGLYQGVYIDCVLIVNFRVYFDLLDTSVMVFVNDS